MFSKILLPTDGSDLSDQAVQAAIKFAQENHSSIITLSVAEPYAYPAEPDGGVAIPFDTEAYEEGLQKLAQQYVDKVTTEAAKSGVECKGVISMSFNPYEEIIQVAKDFSCDVIFMASHGRKGFNKILMGSETQKVLANCSIPILVFR